MHEGKWYCRIHYPPNVAAKREAKEQKWKQDQAEIDRANAIQVAREWVVRAARDLAKAHPLKLQFTLNAGKVCEAVAELERLEKGEK